MAYNGLMDRGVLAPSIVGLAVGVATIILFSMAFKQNGESHTQSFTIDVVDQQFALRATDPETIQQLIDNYNGKNNFHVTGTVVKGDGGFNSPWSWHLDPSSLRMAEVSIELCDGTPSFVEENLDYWLETVHTYCPWSSKVVAINE
jgi:hypothetical protein